MHTEAVPVISENGGIDNGPDQTSCGKQTLTTHSAPVASFYRTHLEESVQ